VTSCDREEESPIGVDVISGSVAFQRELRSDAAKSCSIRIDDPALQKTSGRVPFRDPAAELLSLTDG
jgi:hypothetical protein